VIASPASTIPPHPGIAVGMTAADYDARRHATCVACGWAALDQDADYCRRCAFVAQVVRAWGAEEIRRRLALVEPTLERSTPR